MFQCTIHLNLTKFYKNAAYIKQGSPHPDAQLWHGHNIKWGLNSVLMFNNDLWALILTNLPLSMSVLDNYGTVKGLNPGVFSKVS